MIHLFYSHDPRASRVAGVIARAHGARQEGRGDTVKRSDHWLQRARSAEEVVALVTSGARVFVHGAAATPTPLLDALSARSDLDDVTLYHLHLAGPCAFVDRPTPGGRDGVRTGAGLARGSGYAPLAREQGNGSGGGDLGRCRHARVR